jgi:hypothetical protein
MDKVKYIGLLIGFLSLSFAFDINGAGTPVDYTKIAVSARYWGMGRAGVAFANDSGGFLLNPASFGAMRAPECSLMSTKLLGEFNYLMFNGVVPLQNETVGLSFLNEDAGTIYRTDGVDQYGHPQQGDTIQNYNRVVSFGYGRRAFLDNLYIGGLVKATVKRIDFVEGRSMGADLGVMYRWDKSITFGGVVKNVVQSGMSYSNGAAPIEPMDPDYVVGVSWALINHALFLSLDQHTNPKFGRTNLGAEYWLFEETVALRGGYAEKDFTFGLGFRYDLLQIDFAMRFQEAPMENQAIVSLTYGNARHMVVARPEIEIVDTDRKPIHPPADVAGTKKEKTTPESGSEPQQIQVVN